ncbi:hypothetical protein ACNOYE_15605 [Nannocystaceae bacterium ST9]
MDEIFSCKNCIHNPGQSLNLGREAGYCLQHKSLIRAPGETTCKYLYRKDLPNFVVDEARSEHAAEFAGFPAMVSLRTKQRVQTAHYSERAAWEHRDFDPITNSMAQFYKGQGTTRWIVIQSYAGGLDGRRLMVHGSLTRRYLNNCDDWRTSYRLVLSVVQDMQELPEFSARDTDDEDEARWDLFFSQLASIQEYGWHASIEELTWASDALGDGLSDLDLGKLHTELTEVCPRWVDLIIRDAVDNDAFFTQAPAHDNDVPEP